MITPTEQQLFERPELFGCSLQLEDSWCWIGPTGVYPCDSNEAADALLGAVVDLEGQVLQLENTVETLAVANQWNALDQQLQVTDMVLEIGDDV